MDCSLPGSSVHGIFQARALEWGAIAISEKSPSDPFKRGRETQGGGPAGERCREPGIGVSSSGDRHSGLRVVSYVPLGRLLTSLCLSLPFYQMGTIKATT